MQEKAEPVAFIFRGDYIHAACAWSESERAVPVFADEMPSVAWCTVCEDLIRPSRSCVFCDIVAGRTEAKWILEPNTWHDAVAFVPLDPVTEGHCLVVPKIHVRDFSDSPSVYAAVSRRAAELMRWNRRPMNVITSRGKEATQSVFHLHVHLVPRADDDGLALPWYSGKRKKK
jgi:histidine triad (HIT) family protein